MFARLRESLRPERAPGGHADERWVVVDTETSGLDPVNDRLLAIGAVATDGAGIRVGDSFEVVLRVEAPSNRDNVAIHGIGYETQRRGTPAAAALAGFASYVAGAPCVGFHCDFDRVALAQCAGANGIALMLPRWLDLARLAAAVVPEGHRRGNRSLDDWLTDFDIDVVGRHNAAGDALATAELLLRLRAVASAECDLSFSGLVKLSQQGRWWGGAHT